MRRHLVICLPLILVSTLWADPSSKSDYPLSIKVLSAKTESLPVSSDANDVPTNCGSMDYSAYCHETRSSVVRNTMLVRDSAGKSYTISCTVDSRWSNCTALPIGETFGAQKEKHGITVWYQNSKGKEVKQSYVFVAADKPAIASGAKPASPAPVASVSPASVSSSTATEPLRETVKCNFTSNPPGAEITLDGRYVGSTPSVVGLSIGTHVVVLFMPGFDRWKRELTESDKSDLNVSATLQKSAQ